MGSSCILPHLVFVDSDPSDVRACELSNVAVGSTDAAAAVENLSAGVNAKPAAKVVLVSLKGGWRNEDNKQLTFFRCKTGEQHACKTIVMVCAQQKQQHANEGWGGGIISHWLPPRLLRCFPRLDRVLEALAAPPAGEVEGGAPAPLVEQSGKLVIGVHQLGVASLSLLDAEIKSNPVKYLARNVLREQPNVEIDVKCTQATEYKPKSRKVLARKVLAT